MAPAPTAVAAGEAAAQTADVTAAGDDRARTATARVVLGGVSLAALLLGAVGYLSGVEELRIGELLVFCLIGLGSAPWQLVPTLGLAERIALSFLVGWSAMTAVPMLMGALNFWHPSAAFVLLAAMAFALHVVGLRNALRDGGRPPPSYDRVPETAAPLVLAVMGAVLCLQEALLHQHIEPGIWGFLPHIGALWYIGLGLIGLGFVLAHPEGKERAYAVPVILVVLVLTLTPAIVYDGPRSQAAAKHADLVMQIRTFHEPRSSVGIYNGWDGYFAAIAWLCDVVGIRDPMRLATFWPPLLACFRVAALRFLFGSLLPSAYAAWWAVALAVLADPIGADYFSPQSVGFVVAIVLFAIALQQGGGRRRIPLLLLGGLLLAVTHQLSPYVAGGVLCVLVVFRQVRPSWTPALVLGPAAGWALLHRGQLSGFLSLSDLGKLQNFRPPKTVGGGGDVALARLPVVGDTVHALLLGVLVLGLLAAVAVLRDWRSAQTWALACCPGVGLALVAVNPYGQEGIFRALIFGMPWLAVLAVRLLTQTSREIARVAIAGVTGLLAITFLAASFGLDASNVARPSDLAAVQAFVEQGERAPELTPALLVLGVGDLPTSPPPADATYTIVDRKDLNLPVGRRPSLQPQAMVRALTEALLAYTQQDPRRAALYALWSPVSQYYGVAYGLQPPEEFPALRDAFLASGYWKPALRRGDTILFTFDPGAYAERTA
jgi:hypothetical protein